MVLSPPRKPPDEIRQPGKLQCLPHLSLRTFRAKPAEKPGYGCIEYVHILGNGTDRPGILQKASLQGTAVRLPHPQQKVEQSSLAAAAVPKHCRLLSLKDSKGHMGQHPVLPIVGKADIFCLYPHLSNIHYTTIFPYLTTIFCILQTISPRFLTASPQGTSTCCLFTGGQGSICQLPSSCWQGTSTCRLPAG